jgi:very-short-patch-repair endonuclease
VGFRILRFWNSDVDTNLNGVLEFINAQLIAAEWDAIAETLLAAGAR